MTVYSTTQPRVVRRRQLAAALATSGGLGIFNVVLASVHTLEANARSEWGSLIAYASLFVILAFWGAAVTIAVSDQRLWAGVTVGIGTALTQVHLFLLRPALQNPWHGWPHYLVGIAGFGIVTLLAVQGMAEVMARRQRADTHTHQAA